MRTQVLETVSGPDRVFQGYGGELLAVNQVELGKWLAVVYRELDADGFVITAFLTRRIASLEKRRQVWP